MEKEKKLVFTEHSLCTRPWLFYFSRHLCRPHSTDEKTEPQEGSSTACADRRWQRQVGKPDFLLPGHSFHALGGGGPEGFCLVLSHSPRAWFSSMEPSGAKLGSSEAKLRAGS